MYPHEIYEYDTEFPGCIRMNVLAIILALDSPNDLHQKYPDSELSPYIDGHELVSSTGTKFVLHPNPHAFVGIPPTGGFKLDVEKILIALKRSIVAKDLIPAFKKCDLDGRLNDAETWIRTRDVYSWADQHGLSLDQTYSDYCDDEDKIFEESIKAADEKRLFLETVLHNADLLERDRDVAMEFFKRALGRNVLGEKVRQPGHATEGRPTTTRERNTLLTIIGVLCDANKIDISAHRKAGEVIEDLADKLGIRIDAKTIGNHLLGVPQAMEGRKTK